MNMAFFNRWLPRRDAVAALMLLPERRSMGARPAWAARRLPLANRVGSPISARVRAPVLGPDPQVSPGPVRDRVPRRRLSPTVPSARPRQAQIPTPSDHRRAEQIRRAAHSGPANSVQPLGDHERPGSASPLLEPPPPEEAPSVPHSGASPRPSQWRLA